uniref:Uncharacterized protein n=1 Tax=Stomoxys calcitrans TaxID=35570 RepID=A0A1I8PTF7_STOCA
MLSTLNAEMLNISTMVNSTMVNSTTVNSTMVHSTTAVTPLSFNVTTEKNWNVTVYGNSSTNWNGTGDWSPFYPIPVPIPVQTPSYNYGYGYYYTYAYIYYCLLLLLLIAALICIKLGLNRRRQLQIQAAALQRRARQQAESAGNSNTTATVGGESSCQMETTKVADYPPAYDDIIQASSEVKVPIQDNATSAAGNQIVDNANAISTITIETDTPSNVANNNVSEKSKDPSIV